MTICNALRYRVPAVLFALAVSACVCVAKEDASFKKRSVVAKRELSDDQYNTYAIAHATGESCTGRVQSERAADCNPTTCHARPAVGSAATMIIFPIGVAGARWLRLLSAKWWILHAFLQGFFGLGCIVVAFALSVGRAMR